MLVSHIFCLGFISRFVLSLLLFSVFNSNRMSVEEGLQSAESLLSEIDESYERIKLENAKLRAEIEDLEASVRLAEERVMHLEMLVFKVSHGKSRGA